MRPGSSGRSGGGKLTQDHTQVARSPSGEAAAARRAQAGSLSDALSGPVVTNVIQIQRAPSRSIVPRLLLEMLFIRTGWDVRARCPYSFQATLNTDGTALLLRRNNGRYKTKDTNQTAVCTERLNTGDLKEWCLTVHRHGR